MNIYSQIELEDLNYELRLLADVCGIETIRLLLKELSGIRIYIPKIASIEKFIIRYINSNKYKSIKEVALDLKVSEQHVQNLSKKLKKH